MYKIKEAPMLKDIIYVIPKGNHSEEDLQSILLSHTEIKFVSLIGIDLSGNDTDEKIPVKIFLEDISTFLKGAVQTDGSSVVLPGIASLNNAKVDMLADLDVNWYVDYNNELLDPETEKPVGTLRIPCFLYHENVAVDSRYMLKKSIEHFKSIMFSLFKKYPRCLEPLGIELEDIADIIATSATELEFWVKTPNDQAQVEELSTSQVLKEQYWTKVRGSVRTALEQSLLLMDVYGLEPEMGHKEVGGVKAKIDEAGNLTHIMEQLEIDWKYSNALQAADNELLVRGLVKEVFRSYGLDVTFLAKPMEGVAGSGEHTHIGISLKLKNGNIINLFTAPNSHYLSTFGYGALMGMLKNYEVINPFVSRTNDSFRRLKPGFEAPVCIVTSLGHSFEIPSRNRSVLLGLIRDLNNPLGTRFELRSPNPHSNTYLIVAALYLTMLEGIVYAVSNNKAQDDLLAELSKKPGEVADYLEKSRSYRSEEDVFSFYTLEEREIFFGKAPATVYENLSAFAKYPEKMRALQTGNVLNDKIINSFKLGSEKRWLTEINNRIVSNYADEIRSFKQLHSLENSDKLDFEYWNKIQTLRLYIFKDTVINKSLFTKIKEATDSRNLESVSALQIELDDKMKELRDTFYLYSKNILQ